LPGLASDAVADGRPLEAEMLAEIDLSHGLIIDNLVGRAGG
jgi:hypothetical protein